MSRGNPYYEPDYEKYYYNPPLIDHLMNPESYHEPLELTRWAARKAGPILPAAAFGVPIMVTAWNAYENYKDLERKKAKLRKAEEEQRKIEAAEAAERKKYDIRDDLRRAVNNIRTAERIRLSRENTPLISRQHQDVPSMDNEEVQVIDDSDIIEEVEQAIERAPKPKSRTPSPRNPITKPVLRKLNIPLNEPIRKAASMGWLTKRQRSPAGKVMKLINERQSIEAVASDPKVREEYPEIVEILDDIPSALTSDKPFPEPLLGLLDSDTQTRYQLRRDDAKEQKRLAEVARKKLSNAERKQRRAAAKTTRELAEEAERKAKSDKRIADLTQQLISGRPPPPPPRPTVEATRNANMGSVVDEIKAFQSTGQRPSTMARPRGAPFGKKK